MILCETQRIGYLAPPKTGTASVVRVLQAPPFHGSYQDQHDSYHNTVWESRFQDWFLFLTTRHPYTRAVSYWQYVRRNICCNQASGPESACCANWVRAYGNRLPTFTEFWDNYPDKQRQITIWRASWHLEQCPRPVNQVVHQERLQAELTQIPGFQHCQLERIHEAPRSTQPWHAHYTPDLIARVHEYWGQDFAAFGYNPDFEACVRGEFFTDPSSS
jgi:hypothetical protein